MKITHICLNGPFTDNWSYQDNLLPKYHKLIGYEVSVVTSKYIWNDRGEIDIDNRFVYDNEHGIRIIRIESKYNTTVNSKFKKYKNLYKTINNEKPNIIFVHGCQFLDINDVVTYAKTNPRVKIYVDNHADFSNSATNFISRNILHKIIWKYFAQKINPYTTKFYGVLPARVDFLVDMYNLPKEKVELLVMGADDDKVTEANAGKMKNMIREKYNIKRDDFLIITGGKIDNAKKQTILLMEAVQEIRNGNVKLIVFGSVEKELKTEVISLADGNKVQYISWISSEDTYKYFAAADLVIFPGRHSVFWEQVVGIGKPLIVKYWEGATHINIGGNCRFLYRDSIEEIKEAINVIVNNNDEYQKMKTEAEKNNRKQFLYSGIAKKSIGL